MKLKNKERVISYLEKINHFLYLLLLFDAFGFIFIAVTSLLLGINATAQINTLLMYTSVTAAQHYTQRLIVERLKSGKGFL